MSKMIQIRDVPDELHTSLKARAAAEGMSLSDFIKRELNRTVTRPSLREWPERTKQRKPIKTSQSAAAVLRELRDARRN